MGRRTGRQRLVIRALAVLALGLGISGCSSTEGTPGSAPSATAPAPAPTGAQPLASSTPTRVQLQRIGVNSSLVPLGLNPDRTVQVPPLNEVRQAGWYQYGPTPGAQGPAVILGHIDGNGQPGVFFKLASAHPGDTIDVTRQDGKTAEFAVTRVSTVPKDSFPTQAVYGVTSDAELRLITCGGALDQQAHSYRSNVIVYATLTGQKPA